MKKNKGHRDNAQIKKPTQPENALASLDKDPKVSEDEKRLVRDELVGNRGQLDARAVASEWVYSHVTDKDNPRYGPGTVTASAASAFHYHMEKHSGRISLVPGPKASGKARTKATDENKRLWQDSAKLLWAIEMRENGGLKVSDVWDMAKYISNHPRLNKVSASAGTIKNSIAKIKFSVKKPAAIGVELDS